MLIAGFYVALAALLVLALAARVMWLRNTRRIGLGSGTDIALERAIRVHANATEYLPLALLMLVLLAFEQTRPAYLHGFGIALIVARIFHALGLSAHSGRSFGRVLGVAITMLAMIVMAVMLILRFAVR